MKRSVSIQPNLMAWLRAYPLDQFPIMPRGFRRLRLKFRKQFNLSHDILRHYVENRTMWSKELSARVE